MRLSKKLVIGLALAVCLSASGASAWQNYGQASTVAAAKLDGSGSLYVLAVEGFTVQAYDADTGQSGWFAPFGSTTDQGLALAVDDNDDVIAAGITDPATLTVRKLDGGAGGQVWRHDTPGGAAYAVSALPGVAGDLVVGGNLNGDFAVRRLNGADGTTAWTYLYDDGSDSAAALVLDGAGSVVAVGNSDNDFLVAKVDLATGSEVWRTQLASTAGGAAAVVIAADGDAIVAGALDADFAVVRFDSATGAELWRRTRDGNALTYDTARALALDAAGDVVAGGYLNNFGGQDLAVMKIAGVTGAQLWLREINGSAPQAFANFYDEATAVVVESSGDALVAGGLHRKAGPAYPLSAYLVRLDGATGTSEWDHYLDSPFGSPTASERINALAFDGADHVFTGAGYNYLAPAAVARFGIDGTPGLLQSKVIVVKDKVGFTDKRRIIASAVRDPLIATPAPGSANDPTTAGATVKLVNPTSGEEATFVLPGGSLWEGIGNPAGSLGYKYKDPDSTIGPCTLLIAKPGKLLKVKCTSRTMAIPFTLNEPTQGTMTVSIAFGAGLPQCIALGTHMPGSNIRRDAGTMNPGPAATFKALRSPFPLGNTGPACPP